MIQQILTFLSKGLGILPRTLAQRLGFIGGYALSYFLHREVEVASAQIQFALEYDEARAKKLARKSFGHLGTSVIETLTLKSYLASSRSPRNLDDFKRISAGYPGEYQALSLSQSGQGIVAISGHVGSFELLAAAHMALGMNGAAFGRTPNYSWLETFVETLRSNYGLTTLWRQDPRSISKLMRCLKSGGTVIALLDQDTKIESAFSPFFGLPAGSPVGPLKLAIRYKLPIFSSFIVRKKNGKHKIYTKRIEYTPEDGVQPILDCFHARLERMIRAYPEQWVWWHRRWRRRPGVDYNKNPEKLISTTEYICWLQEQTKLQFEANA